jgi:hypothetical protein
MQTTDNVLMVRPSAFGYNEQTAESNVFQKRLEGENADLSARAVQEFDSFVGLLRSKGVGVIVIEDTADPIKTDAVFPNNWLSLHRSGIAVIYPMAAENRRHERRLDVIELLRRDFDLKELIDLTAFEHEGKFLEGTGSIVFDHNARVAYACESPRTNVEVLNAVCDRIGYSPFPFRAVDQSGRDIYHTNVMMCIGEEFAVVCSESISQGDVAAHLAAAGREIIDISFDQMYAFAGNMLALSPNLLVMSDTARRSLRTDQLSRLESRTEILSPRIFTIETLGGGSVRCMLAENFLPRKNFGSIQTI